MVVTRQRGVQGHTEATESRAKGQLGLGIADRDGKKGPPLCVDLWSMSSSDKRLPESHLSLIGTSGTSLYIVAPQSYRALSIPNPSHYHSSRAPFPLRRI
jgi:hypothetical protein